MADIDTENFKADEISQAANTLWYESQQFRVPELWHVASPPRQAVFALRHKVFGTGGRRLPQGVRGAHGRFNRLQWTLDGKPRLVDYLGRTESEAEEESIADPREEFVPPPPEEEKDAVEHPGIRPMWLLRFFTSWWGAPAGTEKAAGDGKNTKVKPDVPATDTSNAEQQPSPSLST